MTNKQFPKEFIFGTAVASYQVEGGIYNNDWTHWENKKSTICAEPCKEACNHFQLLDEDIELLKTLGIKAFRFSIEWSRVEPKKGEYDNDAINHYVNKAKKLIQNNITPIVTFHHFTSPEWTMSEGVWASNNIVSWFTAYVDKMMQELPQEITYFNTINEPGIFSMFGYFSNQKFPPGIQNEKIFIKASDNIIKAHHESMKIIKSHNANAKVAMTHALHEWNDNEQSVLKKYIRYHLEDKFLFASKDDDYIALQTYSIKQASPNPIFRGISWILIKVPLLRNILLPKFLDYFSGRNDYVTPGVRTTKMGYEYRPQAVKYNFHRIHNLYPDKDIFVTENGIATDEDDERIEFVKEVLSDVHSYNEEYGKIIGYLYWSLLDNFEWDLGYNMNFGLVEIDKINFERKPHKSASWFGEISRTNNLSI